MFMTPAFYNLQEGTALAVLPFPYKLYDSLICGDLTILLHLEEQKYSI